MPALRSVFAGLCLLGFTCSATAQIVVLRGFTLIDGTERKPSATVSAMVVRNGRIEWVGPQAQLKAPASADVIRIDGKFVMPGIINLHGHLGTTIDLTQDPNNYTVENIEKQLRQYAFFGVTTVVSLGTDRPIIYQLRAKQRAGFPTYTRIYTAGRGFTGLGGYPTTSAGMKGVPYEVGSTADVDRDMAENLSHHPDLIKIWVDDHLGREKKIPLALSRRIIEDAHQAHVKVAAHVFYLADAKALVEAGLDGLAHSVRDQPVDEELISRMKQHGAFLQAATLTREISTFYFDRPRAILDDPFFQRAVSPAVLQTLRSDAYQHKIAQDPDHARYPQFLSMAEKNLKKLYDAGVKTGFGTDSGPPGRFQGFAEHWEMELMVEAGLTPQQVITCATRNAAEFLNASHDLGTLEPGKWADFIVLDKNPLDDIRNSRAIDSVYIAGHRLSK